MARLVGVDLPREKRVEIALTYIFGVGRTRAAETLANTGVSPDIRVRDLTATVLFRASTDLPDWPGLPRRGRIWSLNLEWRF